MKKILRNIFLCVLALICLAVFGVWYTLFGVGEKPSTGTDKYVTDVYGTTYLAVVDKDGVTYAVVTDENGNRNSAKYENGIVGEVVGNVNNDVDINELPTNYTGPNVDVTAAPEDYAGDVVTVITTTEPGTEGTTNKTDPQKPSSPSSKPSGNDSEKLKPYRIKKYFGIIQSGNFLMESTMDDPSLGKTPLTIAIKNGNTYVETSMSEGDINLDCKIIYIKSTETTYLLLDNWKKYTKLTAELLGDSSAMDMASAMQAEYSDEDIKDIKVSEAEINGKKLILESYTTKDGTTANYYFDGDALVRRDDITKNGTVATTIYTKFTTDVPDSYFEIPKDYGYLNLAWLEGMM